jgi:hypothetical protein
MEQTKVKVCFSVSVSGNGTIRRQNQCVQVRSTEQSVVKKKIAYTEDAYSSMAPDPAFAFAVSPCCPTLDFVFAFWIIIAFGKLLTSVFYRQARRKHPL